MNRVEYESILAYHPGYYLNDLIHDLEMTQEEFAIRLNITPKNLSNLLNGKADISENIAKNLSLMLGTSIGIWLDLQKKYDEKVIEIRRLEAQRNEENDLSLIDYSYFEMLGVVPSTKDKTEQVSELLRYFSISSFDVFKKRDFLVQFRHTNRIDEKNILNANAWVQTVINIGKQIETEPYHEKKLKSYLPEIRKMTLQNPSEFLPRLSQLLSECGVAFVRIPSLKNSGVYGATKWVNKEKVVLGISNRGKSADIFWFSLLHELGHVLQRKITKTLVDFEASDFIEEYENEANQFAKDTLIPAREYQLFRTENFYSEQRVLDFANSISVHPGVVVGRLQKEGLIPYKNLNKLKQNYIFDH